MTSRILLATVLSLSSLLAAAQAPIYESKDKNGPVFSDQPSAGAKRLDLPPPNVMQMAKPQPPVPAASAAASTAASAASYSRLAIQSPTNQGTIHTNTGAFTLQLQVRPALRASRGDTILVKLDGTQLATAYSSAAIGIKEADWARAAAADVAEHSVQVAVADRTGAVLIESAPVRFFVHRATVGGR